MPYSEPPPLVWTEITEDEILELADNTSSRTDTFSRDKADLRMTFVVPGDKLKPFIQYTMGLAWTEYAGGGVYNLKRKLPMYHPIHTWAWASAVSITGTGFRGDDTDAVVYEDQVTPAKWAKYYCVVSFDMPAYNVLSDSEVDYEYERFTEVYPIPSVELVHVENGQLKYDANTIDNWNNKPITSNTASPQIIARRETAGLRLIWRQVPHDFIAENAMDLPTKLLQAQGRVNNATIFGQQAETLLCGNIHLEKYVQPIFTDVIGQLYFAYDITIDLTWYDPLPKGKTGETRHGWNFMLGPDMRYYYATIGGPSPPAAPNDVVFRPIEFDKIFTSWNDPFTL